MSVKLCPKSETEYLLFIPVENYNYIKGIRKKSFFTGKE